LYGLSPCSKLGFVFVMFADTYERLIKRRRWDFMPKMEELPEVFDVFTRTVEDAASKFEVTLCISMARVPKESDKENSIVICGMYRS
jgi:hypothetical protein